LPRRAKKQDPGNWLAYLDRRLRIPELVKTCAELRPKVSWEIPSQVQLAPLAQAYKVCKDNSFGAFVLERLLATNEPGRLAARPAAGRV